MLNTDSVKYSHNAIQILDCPIAMGHLMLDTVNPRLVALGLSLFQEQSLAHIYEMRQTTILKVKSEEVLSLSPQHLS